MKSRKPAKTSCLRPFPLLAACAAVALLAGCETRKPKSAPRRAPAAPAPVREAQLSGLFGANFGMVMPKNAACTTNGEGELEFKFIPTKPYRVFTDITLAANPVSRQVSRIRAVSRAGDAQNELDATLRNLERKYDLKAEKSGSGSSLSFPNGDSVSIRIEQVPAEAGRPAAKKDATPQASNGQTDEAGGGALAQGGGLAQMAGGLAGQGGLAQNAGDIVGQGGLAQAVGGIAGQGGLAQGLGGLSGQGGFGQAIGGLAGQKGLTQAVGSLAGQGGLAQAASGLAGQGGLAKAAGGLAGQPGGSGSGGQAGRNDARSNREKKVTGVVLEASSRKVQELLPLELRSLDWIDEQNGSDAL